MSIPVTLGASELDANTALLSLLGPKTEIGGAVDPPFGNALCVPKEVVPNAFGIVFRSENADCPGGAEGCQGGSVAPGLKNADCVGLGPKVSVNHRVPLDCKGLGDS